MFMSGGQSGQFPVADGSVGSLRTTTDNKPPKTKAIFRWENNRCLRFLKVKNEYSLDFGKFEFYSLSLRPSVPLDCGVHKWCTGAGSRSEFLNRLFIDGIRDLRGKICHDMNAGSKQ